MAGYIQQTGGDPQLGNFYAFQVWFWLEGQVGINTVVGRFDHTTDLVPTNLGNIAEAFDTIVSAEAVAITNHAGYYLGTKVAPAFKLDTALPGIYSNQTAGTVTGNPAPKQASVLCEWATTKKGPSGRGRVFVPFPSASHCDTDGTPTGAYITDVIDYKDQLLGLPGLTVAGAPYVFTPVIYHRLVNTGTTIVSATVEKAFATHKSRGDLGRLNPQVIG